MSASPSNENPHFPVRLFRAFTGYVTHPYVAWTLFLLLMFFNLAVLWGLPQLFNIVAESTSANIGFYPHLQESQAEIIEEMDKALSSSGDCQ